MFNLSMTIPSVFDDSLSYYEVVSKICDILRDIVPKINDMQTNVRETVRQILIENGIENMLHDVVCELLRDTNPVNVCLLGFDATGETDNLDLFNEFTDEFALQFNKGVYLFSDTVIPKNDIFGYSDGCSSGNSQDTIFRFSNISSCAVDVYNVKCKQVKGITVDIRNWNVHGFLFRHNQFLNTLCENNKVYGLGGGHHGFDFSPVYPTNKYAYINHCSVQGNTLLGGDFYNDSVAYYFSANSPDSLIINSNSQACQKGIVCYSGVELDNVHLWGASTLEQGFRNWWLNTVGIECHDTICNFGHVYIDSFCNGVKAYNTNVVIDSLFTLADGYVMNNTTAGDGGYHLWCDYRSSIVCANANFDLKSCRSYEIGQNIIITNQFTSYLGFVSDNGVSYATSFTKDQCYLVNRTSGSTCVACGWMRYSAVLDLDFEWDVDRVKVHIVNTDNAIYVTKDNDNVGMCFTKKGNGEFRIYLTNGGENRTIRCTAKGGTPTSFIINPMLLGYTPRQYYYRGVQSGENAVTI